MKILDVTAGKRAIWFNKKHPDCLYLDIRPEVEPDIVCDARFLPSDVGEGYNLIVFDPPHVNFGANAELSKTYGHLTTGGIRLLVGKAAKEAHRVSSRDAIMAFKWNDHDQRLDRVLGLMAIWWEPLFGHKVASRTKHSSSTTWVLLKRKDTQ